MATIVESSGTDLSVRFNTGNGFTGEKTFRGALPQPVHGNQRVSRNLGLHFTIPIPIPFTPISIILNPGFYGGESLGGVVVLLEVIPPDAEVRSRHLDIQMRLRRGLVQKHRGFPSRTVD